MRKNNIGKNSKKQCTVVQCDPACAKVKTFLNHQAGLVLDSDVSRILSRKMEEACERKLYSTT